MEAYPYECSILLEPIYDYFKAITKLTKNPQEIRFRLSEAIDAANSLNNIAINNKLSPIFNDPINDLNDLLSSIKNGDQ